ncbi:polyketide synthase, partial [Mycobacterium tuberculosis]
GQAHVAGVGVDWRAAFADLGGRRVELPTYAFARQRFWLDGLGAVGGDLGGVGLVGAEHGLLAAVVQRPDSGGVVLTGRISVVAAPWLADHAVGPVVLFPGTGFVELALRAGDEVGCSVLQELTLQAPLVLPADGVRVQVVVGGVEQSGTRNVWVYSAAGQADSSPGWTLHAQGVLGVGSVQPAAELSVWPPVGARAMDVADGYQV